VLGGDTSGFPNGRRPIDDVVDITLRVAMGVLLSPFDGSARIRIRPPMPRVSCTTPTAPSPIPANYLPAFPYLNTATGWLSDQRQRLRGIKHETQNHHRCRRTGAGSP
jgi:hypothetical protein